MDHGNASSDGQLKNSGNPGLRTAGGPAARAGRALWWLCVLPLLTAAGLALLPARSAGQEEPAAFLDRRLTPLDLLPDAPESFRHGSREFTPAEAWFRERLRTHVSDLRLPEIKDAAYDFMRLRRKVVETARGTSSAFDLRGDMARQPEAWVGRPVVLYGRLTSLSPDGSVARVVALQRDEPLAVVEVLDVQAGSSSLPAGGVPVRIAGFMLKLTNEAPYLIARRIEWLDVETDPAEFHAVQHKTAGIRPPETTAYYDTLMRATLVPMARQQAYAAAVLKARIEQRLEQARRRYDQELTEARAVAKSDPDRSAELTRLALARLAQEERRHAAYKDNPSSFPVFADVFLNPDLYVGKPVTMRGRVRRILHYPADSDRFPQPTLYELWMFTDDSQHNPAVIICPALPDGFPENAEVIDGVTVTGYFFKLYRYAADDAQRAAPMLLARTVQWRPLASADDSGVARTLATLVALCLGAGLLMYVWSSHAGDRRAREALEMARLADAEPTAPAVPAPTQPVEFGAASAPASPPAQMQEPPKAAQASPGDDIIGGTIDRVVNGPDAGDSCSIVLTDGRTITLTNDILEVQSTNDLTLAGSSDYEDLAGAEITHVATDQWDRLYLIVADEVYVTEDINDDGTRCLIYGGVETLQVEEPDLRLIDKSSGRRLS